MAELYMEKETIQINEYSLLKIYEEITSKFPLVLAIINKLIFFTDGRSRKFYLIAIGVNNIYNRGVSLHSRDSGPWG